MPHRGWSHARSRWLHLLQTYENLFFKWDKPKRETPYFLGKTDFTIGFVDPMFPIQFTTFVEL